MESKQHDAFSRRSRSMRRSNNAERSRDHSILHSTNTRTEVRCGFARFADG